jgi:hypothetical protein
VTRPVDRIVGLGFEDVIKGTEGLGAIASNMDYSNANGVSLSVGRTDWAAFPTVAGSDAQSSSVRRTGRDYVAEAITALGQSKSGAKRDVVLVVDTMVDGWISRDASVAGYNADGQRSTEFASMSQLESGAVGKAIVALAGEVAGRYHPTSVSLTELINAEYTFGSDDLASFKAQSGRSDWPRLAGGAIDAWNPAIGKWRSAVVAGLVARAAAATHEDDVSLWMEVRANWSDPGQSRIESGHDYKLLLNAADKLVLWGYFATADRPASALLAQARAVQDLAPGRFVMSIGMWADGDATITGRQLTAGLRATAKGGVRSVWITPTSKMSASHWKALR